MIWLTLAGSFFSRASILLIKVVILASVAMDARDRSLPLEAIVVNSLVFSRLALIAGFSQLNPQINPNPDSHLFARTLPNT